MVRLNTIITGIAFSSCQTTVVRDVGAHSEGGPWHQNEESATKLMDKKQLMPDVSNLVAKVSTSSFGSVSEESLANSRLQLT